jgi:hypothetical protein
MRYTLSLTLLSALAAATASAQESTKPAGRTISGTVRFQDKPVAAATVRLLLPDSPLTKTDAQGRFTLPWPDDSEFSRRELLARDPQGRLGWLDAPWSGDPRFFDPGMRIDLHDVADASGRLTDAAGVPVRQGKLRVMYLEVPEPEFASGRQHQVPSDLAEALTAVTDDDGRFKLKGVPPGSDLYADLTAPGFGSPRLWWKQDVPRDVRLEKAGSIRRRFEGAPDTAKFAGVQLW